MKMISNQQAQKWNNGHPIGNGHMGGMVLNQLPISSIILSENTFYSGEKSEQNNQPEAMKAFYDMREAAKQGHYDVVHSLAEQFVGVRENFGTNLPVGTLFIDYGIEGEELTFFERCLNIFNGISSCKFKRKEEVYEEEIFLSHPDNILVCHITVPIEKKVQFSFIPANAYGEVSYQDNEIQIVCNAYEEIHCDSLCGVKLVGIAKIMTDGCCTAEDNKLSVWNAKSIYLYLHMETDFQMNTWERKTKESMLSASRHHVLSCMENEYAKVRHRHERDILDKMKRVDFQLSSTDELIQKIPFAYQYGRYLLLCSSREDSELPAHLQGIWNDNVACRIGWSCDMHLDINTQMNYWPAYATNLAETAKPLYRFIKNSLSKSGEQTARESYGLPGWVAELVTNAWGFAAPYWASPIAPCPTGGIWILMQMWEHYLFTEDKEFLEEEFFLVLQSAVEFFLGYIFQEENTQWYTSGPSISPENSFLFHEKSFQISNGCTYEITMIRELFQVYLKTCDVLHLDNREQYKNVVDKISKLLPYRILSDGTIAEWNHDLPTADPQHRHTSHLLGLYPFSQISKDKTPLLCEAVEKTIQRKLHPIENWEDTGWARSMLLLYEARLGNKKEAFKHLREMITKLLEPNGMIYHPPTRGANAFDHVYELDGNTGLTMGITEMLLQSQEGILRLLPCLPMEWRNGMVKGLRARGNIKVNMYWINHKLQYAEFVSLEEKECTVSYQGTSETIYLPKGVVYRYEPS
jgi:alpha-L-fucosidase 2